MFSYLRLWLIAIGDKRRNAAVFAKNFINFQPIFMHLVRFKTLALVPFWSQDMVADIDNQYLTFILCDFK